MLEVEASVVGWLRGGADTQGTGDVQGDIRCGSNLSKNVTISRELFPIFSHVTLRHARMPRRNIANKTGPSASQLYNESERLFINM